MAAALDHPVSPSSTETAGVEPVAVDVTPRTADPQDPLERSAAQQIGRASWWGRV